MPIDATAAELEQLGDFQAEILRASGADAADDGPVVRLVNLVIDNAYYMRASDIHIEPMADRVRVRYRRWTYRQKRSRLYNGL